MNKKKVKQGMWEDIMEAISKIADKHDVCFDTVSMEAYLLTRDNIKIALKEEENE